MLNECRVSDQAADDGGLPARCGYRSCGSPAGCAPSVTRPTTFSLNQLAVLGTLDRHGPLTAGELAAHRDGAPPSLTRTVNCLVERGMVAREPHSTDGRQVLVELTEAGRDVLLQERRRRDAVAGPPAARAHRRGARSARARRRRSWTGWHSA